MRSLVLLFTTLTSNAAAATTWYVSASAGADGNTGNSPSAPWRTLPRAVAGAAAGDSLLLRMNDIWDLDAPLVLSGWGSGVNDGSAAPAVLGAYADGQPPDTPRPWVRRAPSAVVGPVVQCMDCAGFVVQGLELSGGEQGLLFSYTAPSPRWGGLTVTDLFVHDIRGSQSGGNPLHWGSGLGFNATARTDVLASNVTVTHNVFNASDTAYQNCITAQTHGGCVWPDGGSGGYVNLDGVLWANNLVNHVAFNSAFFTWSRNTLVTGNTFLDNVPVGLFPLGTTDIIVGASDATLALTDNEIANRGEFAGGPDGCGVDLEDSSSGVTLAGNYISRTWGAGIMLFAGTGAGNKNISLVGNVLLLDGCGQTGDDHGVLAFLHPGQTGTVSNNVLAACAGKQVYNGDTSGFAFSNNTILNASSFAAAVVSTPVVSLAPAGGGQVNVQAACTTPGAVLRYTLDGSRVTSSAPEWPAAGVTVRRATAVLVKAFAVGMIESAVAGGAVGGPRG